MPAPTCNCIGMSLGPIWITFLVAGHIRPQSATLHRQKGKKVPIFRPKTLRIAIFGLWVRFLKVSIHAPRARTHLQVHWGVFGTHLNNISCRRPYPASIGHCVPLKVKNSDFWPKNGRLQNFRWPEMYLMGARPTPKFFPT